MHSTPANRSDPVVVANRSVVVVNRPVVVADQPDPLIVALRLVFLLCHCCCCATWQVLVASSENAIRGLLMHLFDIPEQRISEIEIPTGLVRSP